MIYYPMSVLMMAGIRDILIISTPEHLAYFRQLLGDGSYFGISLSYMEQPNPEGLAQAFIIGEEFIAGEPVAMILGDNVFYGAGLIDKLRKAVMLAESGRAVVFGYLVKDPERFGVIEMGKDGRIQSIEEKPHLPRSNYAATGLYFYDKRVADYAKLVKPSERNELEITDLNKIYLEDASLEAILLSRGFFWMDAGTPQSLSDASAFIRSIEEHQGFKIACLEEIGFNNGWISKKSFEESIIRSGQNDYGKYLASILHLRKVQNRL
jgi:glucose-1-phosphate thymidylyltransferase